MKVKDLFKMVACGAMLCSSAAAHADLLVQENFEYNATTLYKQGPWLQYGSQTGGDVALVDGALTYSGYQDEAVGKAALVNNYSSGQDVMIPFAAEPVTSGSIYVSALVNVQSVTDDPVYFMNFVSVGTSGLQDQRTASEIGRLYVGTGSTNDKFKFKISRNSNSQLEVTNNEFDLGKTYLVVFQYQFVEGTKNDIVRLWVNPTNVSSGAPKADAAILDMTTHTSADGTRMQAVELRQGSSASYTGPQVKVDAMRIADTWTDLFDITPSDAPELTVTPTQVFTDDAAPMGQSTTFATFKVDYKNMTSATQVYLTGANANQYGLSTTSIPAGDGTAEVTVFYNPTAIGKHTARINFETTPSTLNCGYNFTSMAYDPNNMPTIGVNASGLTQFKCKAGETVQQTFTVTTANLPDYGKAAVAGTAKGAFLINNTMLLKNGTAQITVTFKPNNAGTYNETITFTGVKAEPQTLTLTGVATESGEPEADAEGDRLPLSNAKAYTYLNETFDGAVKNQVLAVDEWRNLAMQGKRAWWGYEWTDDANRAAKVTAYDSKVESGASTPAQMLLVTPPLDYKNATKQVLSFRLMGDFMFNGMDDLLEVCYIENDADGLYIEPIEMSIPCTPDMNKEWQDYELHLENQNIADVFYIGFRFTSRRGSDNTCVYYIDNVVWGEENPAIKGDINGDGLVDVVDLNCIINIMLGDAEASDYSGNADLNGDGSIDVADVNALINMMLE